MRSFLFRLLQRLGFVRLSDHGLALSPDGRVVSSYPLPSPTRQFGHAALRAPVISAPPAPAAPLDRHGAPGPALFGDTETSVHGPTHVDIISGTNPGGFWNPKDDDCHRPEPAPGDKTQLLDLGDLLDCKNIEYLDDPSAMAPGVVPDRTRVDMRCPDFDLPGYPKRS